MNYQHWTKDGNEHFGYVKIGSWDGELKMEENEKVQIQWPTSNVSEIFGLGRYGEPIQSVCSEACTIGFYKVQNIFLILLKRRHPFSNMIRNIFLIFVTNIQVSFALTPFLQYGTTTNKNDELI
jgi:hypothetical protein